MAQLPQAVAAASAAGGEGGPLVAALVLGSVASPRLVYLLHVAPPPPPELTPPASEPRSIDAATRRLVRALAVQASGIAGVDPGLCRLHLLLRAARGATLPPGHFRARPSLVVRLKRAHLVAIQAVPAGVGDGDGPLDMHGTPPWASGLVSDFVPPLPRRVQRHRHTSADESAHAAPISPSASAPSAEPYVTEDASAGTIGRDAHIWWEATSRIKGYRLPMTAA